MSYKLKPKLFSLLIIVIILLVVILYGVLIILQNPGSVIDQNSDNPISLSQQQDLKTKNLESTIEPLKPDTILVRVGQQIISASELNQYVMQDTRSVKMAETDMGRVQILREMIIDRLIQEGIRREGFLPKDQPPTQKDFIQGYSLLAAKYFPEAKKIPGEEIIHQYYLDHQESFGIPAMVRVGQIQFRVPQSASSEQKRIVRERAVEVLQRLRAGESFADLANQFTENPQGKGSGGDLGFLPVNQDPWLKQATNMGQGQYSEVLESPAGYEILQVKDRREALIAPYASVRESVLVRLRHEIRRRATEAYAWRLAKDVGVTIERKEFDAAIPSFSGD